MTLAPTAKVGERVGRITYPTQGCEGDLIRLKSKRGQLRAKEHLSTNPDSRCIDDGFVIVPVEPQDEYLPWVWLFPDGSPGASATLRRVDDP